MKKIVFFAAVSFFCLVSQAQAGSVGGTLGRLVVTQKDYFVEFDNRYSACGGSQFILRDPNWNDIKILAEAVQSGRQVHFEFKCSGNRHYVTHFRWR